MRTPIVRCALALGLVAAASPSANATDFCYAGEVIDIGPVYVALDEVFGPDYWLMFWVYAETNGESGLQRGGANLLGDADVCQNFGHHDQAIF